MPAENQHGGRRRGEPGCELDEPVGDVVRVPHSPNVHHVRGAAQKDEHREERGHPPIGQHSAPATNEIRERHGDGVVGEGDQRIGAHMQPQHIGPPQVAVSMGMKLPRCSQSKRTRIPKNPCVAASG
jgi:hypothetical protein